MEAFFLLNHSKLAKKSRLKSLINFLFALSVYILINKYISMKTNVLFSHTVLNVCRMKKKFYSWDECLNLREVKVFLIFYFCYFLFLLIFYKIRNRLIGPSI